MNNNDPTNIAPSSAVLCFSHRNNLYIATIYQPDVS